MKKVFFLSPIIENLVHFRRELILSLAGKGYDVFLLCSFQQKYEEFEKAGVKFINIDIDRRGTNPINELRLLKSYYGILKKEKPDVVLTYTSKCSVYGGMVCRWLKIPYIINNSGLFDPNRIGKLFGVFLNVLHRIGYSNASCLMFQNSAEKDFFQRILWKKVPSRLLPGSGVNLERFEPQPYPIPVDCNFLIICRIQREKGIEEYLHAATILKTKYPKTQFGILGRYDEDYHERIEKLQQEKVVNYHEPVNDIRPFLKNTHCVVNPSYHEGMSNVLLEAAASGRPAIASNCPGCNDIIRDGINGFLVNVADADDLADKMEKFILLSNSEREQMGKNGRKIVEEAFDRDIVIRAYIEEIEKVCQ